MANNQHLTERAVDEALHNVKKSAEVVVNIYNNTGKTSNHSFRPNIPFVTGRVHTITYHPGLEWATADGNKLLAPDMDYQHRTNAKKKFEKKLAERLTYIDWDYVSSKDVWTFIHYSYWIEVFRILNLEEDELAVQDLFKDEISLSAEAEQKYNVFLNQLNNPTKQLDNGQKNIISREKTFEYPLTNGESFDNSSTAESIKKVFEKSQSGEPLL